MNERIKELAGKALDEAVPETWTTLTAYDLNKFTVKFAELIVRECAAVANINSHQWQVPGDFVLKHFEVKE